MAREFDRASSQYLRHGVPVLTAVPITMACWFNLLDVTTTHFLLAIINYSAGASGGYFALEARGNSPGDYLRANVFDGGAGPYAETAAGYSSSTWHHGCAVFATNTDRRVYLDGANKGTNAGASNTPPGLDSTSIGTAYRADNPAVYTDGSMAEVVIWNAALTDAEVAVLATGIRPIRVRPQNLVAYWPLVRDQDYDLVGGYDMTPINGPTISAHVAVAYGAPPTWWAGTAAAPSGVLPGAMDTYRRRRV